MAAVFRLKNAAASAAAGNGSSAGLTAFIAASPKIIFYTGDVNGTAESAPAGTALCAAITLDTFGTATNGVITSANSPAKTGAATESGTAGCFCLFKSDGSTQVADGNVGTADTTIVFDDNVFVDGGTISVGEVTITIPPG